MLLQKNLIIASVFSTFFSFFTGVHLHKKTAKQAKVKTVKTQCDINFSDYEVHEKKVQKNEVLTDLFKDNNLSREEANTLIKTSKEVFNPSKIRAGNSYFVLGVQTKNGDFVPKKLIYEESNIDFVVFHLTDSLYACRGQKEVTVKHREIAGIIRGSLYGTFDNLDLNPAMAVDLSEIFACDVDFYKIQEGDKFKIIFDENFVDNQSVGIKNISAAVFNSGGKEFYAFYYSKNGENLGAYYDEKGGSMRKQFLKSPVKFARISSRFNLRRFHPVAKEVRAHLGTDYAAAYGTPIIATADGIVEEAQFSEYNGNYVKLRHNGQYKTQYLHMSRIADGMHRGVRVSQGQTIGYVGSTGLATGPHVCYRFWKDGRQIDPLRQSLRFSEPLPKREKEHFLAKTAALKMAIDRLAYTIDPKIYQEEKRLAQIKEEGYKFLEAYF